MAPSLYKHFKSKREVFDAIFDAILEESKENYAQQAAKLNIDGNDVKILALQFYAPIYMLRTVCDRQPDRESEALKMIEEHIRQFNRNYLQEGEQ